VVKEPLTMDRRIQEVDILDQKCLLMPYYEDQSEIVAHLKKLEASHGKQWLKQVLNFDFHNNCRWWDLDIWV
jgi:hypothetical protein